MYETIQRNVITMLCCILLYILRYVADKLHSNENYNNVT